MKIVKKILAVIIIVIGLATMALFDFTNMAIIVGTIIMIVGGYFWVTSNQKSYNNAVDTAKKVDEIGDTTLKEVYQAFRGRKTPLGEAWMGKVQSIKEPCIIFGPGVDGDFIYIRQEKKCFYISYCESEFWLKSSEEEIEKHRPKNSKSKKDNGNVVCDSTDVIAMVDEMYQKVDTYVHDRAKFESVVDSGEDTSVSYRFNEEFKWLGQDFSLCEMDGTKIYDIKGTVPLKSFRIYKTGKDTELFRMTKKILHVMPQYEFYYRGEFYGKFQKKVDLIHDTFEMKTPDGMLQMRSTGATIGENYIVKMNDRVIGSIADKMNASLEDVFFDNYVIIVREEKYRLLMTALGVMAARELARDEADEED